MRLVLAHPQHGYYATRDPLGAAGDFITAPEISQMFGELLGLWCAHVWGLIGAPRSIRLVELGPGRGTLIADALRACARVAPPFVEAVELHLVETSPVLRERQRLALADYAHDRPVQWHDTLSQTPRGISLIIGNEFLDALPVHQLVRMPAGWCERLVGKTADGRLEFRIAPTPSALASTLDPQVADAPIGSLAELSPKVRAVSGAIGRRVARFGGAALLIDYGHALASAGDTLQAVRRHMRHDILAEPGTADLTAHVDFSAVANAAEAVGARAHGPVEQGVFLSRLGIIERALALSRVADQAQAQAIEAALERLIDPAGMGSLFKVLGLAPKDIDMMPGFVQ